MGTPSGRLCGILFSNLLEVQRNLGAERSAGKMK